MAIKTLDDDELAEMVHYNKETRYRIKDTSSYPHKAIARMIMKFFSKPDLFAGTGFLTDDYIFITAAHNVREDRLKNAAEITIYFGLDGDTNWDNVKPIQVPILPGHCRICRTGDHQHKHSTMSEVSRCH